MIGVGIIAARVMTYEQLKSREIIGSSQDGNRKWMLLLAAKCAVAATVPPTLIYKGESGDLRNTWTNDIGQDTVYFAATLTGWNINKIGRQWLEMVFDNYTKEKEGNRGYRLLLVDGHCSHVKLDFFDYVDKH